MQRTTRSATTRHSDDARPRFWSSYDRSRLRHRGFMSSRKTSTRTPAPSVKTRSSKCRGPKRKSPVANGQSSVRLNIVATARRTSARAEFGRLRAVINDALKDRLTKIRLTIVRTNEKNASARTSSSGKPRLNATMKIARRAQTRTLPARDSR